MAIRKGTGDSTIRSYTRSIGSGSGQGGSGQGGSGQGGDGRRMGVWLGSFLGLLACCGCGTVHAETQVSEWPVIFREDFEQGWSRWQTTDPDGHASVWQLLPWPRHGRLNHVLRVSGPSLYQPPVRSPASIAWLRDVEVEDFSLQVELQSTSREVGDHRDLCLFWGYQDPSHFYYAHLATRADEHACQIFLVNGAPRTKITTRGVSGLPWPGEWVTVRVVRTCSDGHLRVYWGDSGEPVLEAVDTTLIRGRIGLGTFDDHGNFDNVELRAPRTIAPGTRSQALHQP